MHGWVTTNKDHSPNLTSNVYIKSANKWLALKNRKWRNLQQFRTLVPHYSWLVSVGNLDWSSVNYVRWYFIALNFGPICLIVKAVVVKQSGSSVANWSVVSFIGVLEEIIFETRLDMVNGKDAYHRDETFINGLPNYQLFFREHVVPALSDMITVHRANDSLRIDFKNFVPGSVIAFRWSNFTWTLISSFTYLLICVTHCWPWSR